MRQVVRPWREKVRGRGRLSETDGTGLSCTGRTRKKPFWAVVRGYDKRDDGEDVGVREEGGGKTKGRTYGT